MMTMQNVFFNCLWLVIFSFVRHKLLATHFWAPVWACKTEKMLSNLIKIHKKQEM